jgi:DNA-binding NarL/FixJ family response regulator
MSQSSHVPSVPSPIRVVLVDDHPMVRKGLRMSLLSTEGIDVVGEAEDSEQALRVCAELHPDVVLMDLRLPGLDGAATTWALRDQAPVPQVVVLTASYDERLISEALAAGASGYVLKGGSVDELIASIRDAHARQ